MFHIKWDLMLIYYLTNVILPIQSGVFPDSISYWLLVHSFSRAVKEVSLEMKHFWKKASFC